jgi:hypothetical protein
MKKWLNYLKWTFNCLLENPQICLMQQLDLFAGNPTIFIVSLGSQDKYMEITLDFALFFY